MQERKRKIAIVGNDRETEELRSCLNGSEYYNIIKCLDPEKQHLTELSAIGDLDMIVNLSDNRSVGNALKKLHLPRVDVISNLSAELLFCTIARGIKPRMSDYQWKVLENLQDIRRSVFLTKNIKELLKRVLSIALQSLDADSGSIMLSDPQKRTLTIEMSHGLQHVRATTSAAIKYGNSIAGKVAQSGKPLIIKGNLEGGRQDVISAISCPLTVKNTTVGVLNINSKRPQRVFDNTDLRFITKLASFTADIIQTSREYTQRAHVSLSHTLLSGIRDILDLDFPLQERLNLLLMKTVNSFQGIICNFYLFDKESEKFYVYGSSSFDINKIQAEKIRLNDFFTGRVIRNKEAFTFQASRKSGTQKWFIAQPMYLDGEMAGLLLFHLLSDSDRIDKEKDLMGKVVKMLEQEFSKAATLGTAQLSTIKYSALSELTFDLAEIHDIRKIAKLIVTNACLIMEAESCILSLYNETMNCFEPLESFSLRGQKQINILQKVDKAIALNTSIHKDAVLIPDLLSNGYISEQVPSRCVISMCLRKNNKIMALLSIYDKNRFGIYDRKGFSRLDKEVFTKYCLQTTKALNRFLLMKTG